MRWIKLKLALKKYSKLIASIVIAGLTSVLYVLHLKSKNKDLKRKVTLMEGDKQIINSVAKKEVLLDRDALLHSDQKILEDQIMELKKKKETLEIRKDITNEKIADRFNGLYPKR